MVNRYSSQFLKVRCNSAIQNASDFASNASDLPSNASDLSEELKQAINPLTPKARKNPLIQRETTSLTQGDKTILF